MEKLVLQQFYNLFWGNESCQEIFLNHKEQLLEKDEIEIGSKKQFTYLPRLVLSNSLKKRGIDKRLVERIESKKIELNHALEGLFSEKLIKHPEIEQKLKSRFEKPFEIVVSKLNGSKITQTRFLTEIASSVISEKRLLKFLRKYGFIGDEIKSFDQLSNSIEHFIENEINRLTQKDSFQELLNGINDLSEFYSNHKFDALMNANAFYLDVLYDKDNYQSRLDLFDNLYDIDVLQGGHYKTYYECTNCNVGVFSGNVSLNVTPSKVKLKCPNCNKEVFYLAPYKIHSEITNHITHKDGLLFFAIKSCLLDKGISFLENYIIGPDIEIDIAITKNQGILEIIEVKQFKTDRPEDTQLHNLRDALSKIGKRRQKLIEIDGNYEYVRFSLMTNISDPELINEAKSTSSKIVIVPSGKVCDYLNEIV